mgnify:FL=1
MERKDQLKNVSFGGDWSEQIVVRENVAACLATAERAVRNSCRKDPCHEEALAAVDFLCAQVARGGIMAASWRKAGRIADQGLRRRALEQTLKNIRSGIGRAALD